MGFAGESGFIGINEELRECNFNAFEKRYGYRPQIDPDENEKYAVGVSKLNNPVLYIRNASNSGDLRMNSIYDPMYEAARWADKFEYANRRTTIVLFGFGMGYYLLALLEKLRPDTVFFVYEPREDLFSFVCGYLDFTELILSNRIKFYLSEEKGKTMSQDLIADLSTNRPEAKGLVTPFYSKDEIFTKACNEADLIMQSNMNYQRDRGRKALLCRMYAWNHMMEAKLLVDLKKVIPTDVPAIIVAAGPSLRKNVEVLKKIKGHALIICTDRAVSVLDEFGIEPDIITSIDAEKNPKFIDYHVAKNVPIICSYQLNKETQRMFKGRIIFFHSLIYERVLLGEKIGPCDGLDMGGNVAGGSFILCEQLGIKTIVLIGQDLAFLNGKHHADGKSDGVPTIEVVEIEGIDGKLVQSNDMWIQFKQFYERQINLHPDIRVIDATEGGALIKGTEIMSLEDVFNTICTGDCDFRGIFDKLPYAQNKEEYLETVRIEKSWVDDLDMIIRNSKELVTICSQLLKVSKYQDITDPKYEKKLKKMDSLRADIYVTVVNVLMEEFWYEDMYGIPDYTMVIRNNEEAIPVFENAVEFFTKLPEDCESLKKELLEAIEEGKEDQNVEL